jgi:hypothetical protein
MYYNGAPRPNWQIGNGLNYFGISVLTSIGNDGSVQSNPGLKLHRPSASIQKLMMAYQ